MFGNFVSAKAAKEYLSYTFCNNNKRPLLTEEKNGALYFLIQQKSPRFSSLLLLFFAPVSGSYLEYVTIYDIICYGNLVKSGGLAGNLLKGCKIQKVKSK